MSQRKRVAYRKLSKVEEDQMVVLYKEKRTIDEIKEILKIEDGRQITGILAARGLFENTGPKKIGIMTAEQPVMTLPSSDQGSQSAGGPREVAARARLEPEPSPFVRDASRQQGGQGSQGSQNLGYIPAQTSTIEYRMKRQEPDHGYVGKLAGPFDVSKLGARYGNGKYLIEEWRTGERMASRVWEETITGHGDPRWPGTAIFGEGASAMQQTPASNPADIARVTLDALKAGAEMATPKAVAPVAPPPPSLAEKAGEKVINSALENLANPPKSGADNWLQTFMQVEAHKRQLDEAARKQEHDTREEERKRERQEREDDRKREKQETDDRRKQERDDDDRRRKQEREDEDRRHQMAMDKLKLDADAKAATLKAEMDLKIKEIEIKASAQAEAAKALQEAKEEIADERLNLAIEKQNEAQQATQDAIAANETRMDARMATLSKENADKLAHEMAVVELKKDLALKSIEVERARTSGEDPFVKIIDKVLMNVNDRTKEAIAAKTAQTALEQNPGVVNNALKNPETMNKVMGGAGVPKFDQLVKTPEFQEFLVEWCLHVSETTPPEFLFETILRQQRANAPGINEFIDFITPRRWALVKKAVWAHITTEQQEILDAPYAEDFYEKLKAMISIVRLQILKACVKSDLERVEVQVKNEGGVPVPVTTAPAATPAPTPTSEAKKEEVPAPVPAQS